MPVISSCIGIRDRAFQQVAQFAFEQEYSSRQDYRVTTDTFIQILPKLRPSLTVSPIPGHGDMPENTLYIMGIIGEVLMLTSLYLVMPVVRITFRHALIGGVTATIYP